MIYLRIWESFKSAKKWVYKSHTNTAHKFQILNLLHLRKFENLRIFILRNLFAEYPPLPYCDTAPLNGTYPGWRTRMNLVHVRG
jgi:hypothetical protein